MEIDFTGLLMTGSRKNWEMCEGYNLLVNNVLNDNMAKKKKEFIVTLTMIYNATVEVEADSADKAIEYVNENIDTLAPDSIFNRGEKTVDFADLIEA